MFPDAEESVMTDHGNYPGDMPDVSWLLGRLAEEVPGVASVVLVSSDGLQLATAGPIDRTLADSVSALTSGLLGIVRQLGRELAIGEPETFTIRYPHGHLAFVRIGDAAGLFAAASVGTDLKRLGYGMGRFAEAVGHALTPQVRRQLHLRTIGQAVG
jgi:predicted regulator of Ras-like GTPase activity (Roadblock/LC7/MglB family)